MEAKKFKELQKAEAQKKRDSYLAARRRSSARAQHQEEVENMYEKISPEYLTVYDEQNLQDDMETLDDGPSEHFEAINYRRTESYSSFDVQNNAELILRELFVPIQEENCEGDIVQDAHEDRKMFKRNRRNTGGDLSWTGTQRSLPAKRFSFTSGNGSSGSRRPSDKFRSSISSNTVSEDTNISHHKRRRAIVFSTQLSVHEDSYSTVV